MLANNKVQAACPPQGELGSLRHVWILAVCSRARKMRLALPGIEPHNKEPEGMASES